MLGLILKALLAERKLAFIKGIARTMKTARMIRRVMDPHYWIRLYASRLYAGLRRSEALHGILLSRYQRDKLLVFRISNQLKRMNRENYLYFEVKSQIRKYLNKRIELQKLITRARLRMDAKDKKRTALIWAKLQKQIARYQKRLWAQNRREVWKIFYQKQRQEKKTQFARWRQFHEDRGYLMGYRHLSHFRNWSTPEEAEKTSKMRGDTRWKQRPVIALPFFSSWLHEGVYYRDTHSTRLFMKQRWYSFKKFQWQVFKHMADAGTIYQPSYLDGWRGAGTVYWREYKGVFNYKDPLTKEEKFKKRDFLKRGGTVKNTGETRFIKNFNKGLIHTKKEHGWVKTKWVDEFAYQPGRKYKDKFINKREWAKYSRNIRREFRSKYGYHGRKRKTYIPWEQRNAFKVAELLNY